MAASNNPQLGGAFDPTKDVNFSGSVDFGSNIPTVGTPSLVTTTATQTLTNKTLTAPAISAAVMSGTSTGGTFSGTTFTGSIDQDYTVLAATQSFQTNTVLATLTGLTATLTAAKTYNFEIELYTTQTTNGGLEAAFHYTNSLTLTSIAAFSQQVSASAIATAQFTTTTDQSAIVNNKTAVYLMTRITGTLVVNAGGTISVQACQNTSNSDTTSVLLGSFARFTRVN